MKIKKDKKLLEKAISIGVKTAGELACYLRTQQYLPVPVIMR